MAEEVRAVKKIELLLLAILLATLMTTALAVIYCKNYSRSIFSEIERHERALQQYEVEWGQMQLEISTLAEQNRVESIARRKLNLILPLRDNIIYIKP